MRSTVRVVSSTEDTSPRRMARATSPADAKSRSASTARAPGRARTTVAAAASALPTRKVRRFIAPDLAADQRLSDRQSFRPCSLDVVPQLDPGRLLGRDCASLRALDDRIDIGPCAPKHVTNILSVPHQSHGADTPAYRVDRRKPSHPLDNRV